MMRVHGETAGGRLDQLVPDEQVSDWIATVEAVSALPITWTVQPVVGKDLRTAKPLTSGNAGDTLSP